VRLALADSLRESGDAAAAREEYRKLLASDPSLAQAHFGLGRTLSGAEAELAFRKALDRFPRYGAAQFVLAAELRRTGRTPEAAKVLANYERDKLVAPAIADPAMDRIFLLNESSTGLIRRAQILDSEGHPAEALALHERVVRTAPKMEQAWINMISLYARGGQPGKAEDAYRKAIALAPARAEAHYNFGVFCFNSERWADAAKAFAKALALDPNHAAAAHNLGAVVERTGDLTRAAGLFRRAIANQPDHRLARFHLGRIYANRRQFDLAAAEFERIIQPLDDQSATYLYALGATYARAGRRDKAVASLQQARKEAQARGQQAIVQAVERDLATLWNNR
jgi:tetratricopeptide (TPR) repeat protein